MVEDLKRRLAESVIRSRPDEAARVLERRTPAATARALEALKPSQGVELLRAMVPSVSAQVLATLSDDAAKELLLSMPPGTVAALLRRLPEDRSTALLSTQPEDRKRKIELLGRQRPGTAGAVADSTVLVLGPRRTAGDVLTQFRVELIHATHEIPVLDEDDRLVGMAEPRRLTSAKKVQRIEDIMTKQHPRLLARMPLRSLATHAAWQTHSALPVVDASGVFIGMLSHETSRSVLAEASDSAEARPISTSEALGDVFGLGVGGIVDALFQPFGRE